MEFHISKKVFLEQQIETIQKNIWNLQVEIRLLERGKISAGQSKLLEIEKAIGELKRQIDYFEKKQEVFKDFYKELTGEEVKLSFN